MRIYEITERSLTKGEEKKKEKFVKGMKKNKKDFKKRYGDDAKAVMYATATNMAKENVANDQKSNLTRKFYTKMRTPTQLAKDLKRMQNTLNYFSKRGIPGGSSIMGLLKTYGSTKSGELKPDSATRDAYKKYGNPSVDKIQVALELLGFNPGPIDGQYGSKVYKAVQAFQKANGLTVDGDTGPKTLQALIDKILKLPVNYTDADDVSTATKNTSNLMPKSLDAPHFSDPKNPPEKRA